MTLSNASASQVAVITGGSRGIGYNVAAALVARGTKVIIGDINDKDGKTAVEELNKRLLHDTTMLLRKLYLQHYPF